MKAKFWHNFGQKCFVKIYKFFRKFVQKFSQNWRKIRNFCLNLIILFKFDKKNSRKIELNICVIYRSKSGKNLKFLLKLGQKMVKILKILRKFRNFSLNLFKKFRKITENSNVLFKWDNYGRKLNILCKFNMKIGHQYEKNLSENF